MMPVSNPVEYIEPLPLREIIDTFTPKRWSLKWFGRKVKNFFKALLFPFVFLGRKIKAFFKALLKLILAISNGVEVAWEFISTAFVSFIDREFWEEIKTSQILRQTLGLGILVTTVWFLYSLTHRFNWYSATFFTYQALRLLAFLGMENKVIETPKKEKGTIRSFKTADELMNEGEEDEDYF